MDPDEAARLYLKRIEARIPDFETMNESDLNYIKLINAGEKQIVNNVSFGYISGRIVFYLTNLHVKFRRIFFARAGTSCQEESYKADAHLSPAGQDYAERMTGALIHHRQNELDKALANGLDEHMKTLTVWTSTRKRTVETAEPLGTMGFTVRQRSQMSALNPGVCERLTEQQIMTQFPEEVEKHEVDPYHHRYPRAEVSLFITSEISSLPSRFEAFANLQLLTSLTMISLSALNQSFSNLSVKRMTF